MALITRCPQCHTAFKVVADQLRVHRGLVRCGECGTVFDGRACLEPPEADAPAAVGSGASRAPAPVQPRLAVEPAVLRGRSRIARSEPSLGLRGDEDSPPGQNPDEDDEEPVWDDDFNDDDARRADLDEARQPVAAVYGEARTRMAGQADAGRTPPEFLDADRIASRRIARVFWAALCCLGVLLLALQLLYVYRTALAMAVPALRPVLTAACQPLGCQIGYARRIERISIVSSSLRPPKGASQHASSSDKQRLDLTVVLRNRYDQPQHWPALVINLTDLSDTVVARKVLRPETFLTPQQLAGPMPPQAEITARIPIEVDGMQVNGYQLDKFFP